MRGKVTATPANAGATGITPAYAGKRSGWVQRPPRSRDHPRVCGEKHHVPELLKALRGITPAYAGKRRAQDMDKLAEGDHPRVCGEKTKKIP